MSDVNSTPEPLYLSQSEAVDWAGCHLRACAKHVDGYRSPDDDGLPQRVGTVGHAIVAEMLEARWYDRAAAGTGEVCDRVAAERGWPEDVDLDLLAERARPGVEQLWSELGLEGIAVVPDLFTGRGGPMIERRVAVPWRVVRSAAWDPLAMPDVPYVYKWFAGIEGQPDLVVMPHGAGGPAVIVDYKFRQRADLGGTTSDPAETVPNRQAAWYLTLLRAAGLAPAAGFEFWQANVYAGPRLTADDFVRVADGGAQSEAEEGLVIQSGLPTVDIKRIGKCGLVSADEWAEAHRVLTNRRHDRRTAAWRDLPPPPAGSRAKPKPPPQRLTAAEEADAREFIAVLRAQQTCVVRRTPADPYVCREVVRDMLVAVDGPLGQVMRGVTPARNLQDHPSSPCRRPFGCPFQTPCLSSVGTWDVREALAQWCDAGALTRVVRPARPLGMRPAGVA